MCRFTHELLESRTLLSAGDVDTTFGIDGVARLSVAQRNAQLTDTAIMSDGRFVVAGTSQDGTLTVARFTADGIPDIHFGDAGRAVSRIGGSAQVFAVAIQSDNKIVVGGARGTNAFLLRYQTNGKHDRTFGNGGLIRFSFPGAVSSVQDIAILDNGQIVAAGEARGANGTNSVALARFNSDGRIDRTFGDVIGLGDRRSGVAVTKFGFSSGAADTFDVNRLAIAPNGSIFVAGRWFNGDTVPRSEDDALAIAQFDADGAAEMRFGSGGLALRDLGAAGESATGIIVDAQSRPTVSVGGADVFGALRFDSRGRADSSFGSRGLARASFGSGDTGDIALDDAGAIVIGGRLGNDAVLARLDADSGALDNNFGINGISAALPLDGDDALDDIGVQRLLVAPDSTILAVGTADEEGGSPDLSTARVFGGSGPVARASTRVLTESTNASFVFFVQWRASGGIDASTLGNGDLHIRGPNGFARTARFVVADHRDAPHRIIARYKVAPPASDGAWGPEDNGTYTINVVADQVADLDGLFADARSIGSFIVQIP